jgi:hypothetical protein
MRRLVLITLCAVILPASLTRSEQRTITVTGFAIHEFPADWIHLTLTVKLEGKIGKHLTAAMNAKADSAKAWLKSLGPDACSLSVSRIGHWNEYPCEEGRNPRPRTGLSCYLNVWLSGRVACDQALQKYGSVAEYSLQVLERGLRDDTAAVREVSVLALNDARAQAATAAEVMGMTLAEPLSVKLNPISEIQEPNGYGVVASCWGRDSFYSRGQVPGASGRFVSPAVIRRAVALITYAVQ